MDSALTIIVLLGCCSVCPASPSGPSGFSMVFCGGTQLLVKVAEPTANYDKNNNPNRTGSHSGPSVQILSSASLSRDPGSPHLLVCLLSGLNSPVPGVLWWLNDTVVKSAGATVMSEEGGVYSATSVWEVSAADWRSTYWCGTIQKGQVYRQKLCSEL